MKKFLLALSVALAVFSGFSYAAPSAPKAGTDYTVLANPQPNVSEGKIEVTEFFWYGCPHCADFEPLMRGWAKKQGADIVVKKVPVAFREDFMPHSYLYNTLVALGVEEKLTPLVFKEIQVNKNYLLTEKAQIDFVTKQGIDREKFTNAYHSFSVKSAVDRDKKMAATYKINGIPTIVVEGKYMTSPSMTNSLEGTIQVLDFLVKEIRAKKM